MLFRSVAILRTASDFDRPYPGQETDSGLHAQLLLEGASTISTENLVKAGMPLVEAIVSQWPKWQAGVPAN